MALVDKVKEICIKLAPHGWRDLLLQHGLDIIAEDLKDEFLSELTNINRNVKGFEDFALEGKRGIEPGIPSRSLLYHTLSSPGVDSKIDGSSLEVFPTIQDIEIVENYVYGISPPSIAEIRQRANGNKLALSVFASEYRPASETVHKNHADKCFSRTAVSRIGTKSPIYDYKSRGFLPFDANKNAIRVLPSQFSIYIAVNEKGNKKKFGPMRFQERIDEDLDFWIPLHKIFNGTECIRGFDLNVQLEAFHVNEKLRRIHLELRGSGGWAEPDINQKPFIFSDNIAEFTNLDEYGSGLLIPIVHSRLVEPAEYKGKPLTFTVPENTLTLSSSMYIPSENETWRHAPEYVHVRHQLTNNGTEENLNNKKNIVDIIRNGRYQARHYIDFTGDGWIKPICQELAVEFPDKIYAYSLVTAPDFFPHADQGELMDWWEMHVPDSIKEMIWRIPPRTLSDSRISPNLQLPGSIFRREDKTYTTIISLPINGQVQPTKSDLYNTYRHSYLPDAASSIYQPGWDVSLSRTKTIDQTEHLASYGLGSPFPEDAKLCAALSTFWPGVAPDAARTFEPNIDWPTVCPLTDEEIGITGNNPWDGIMGPKIVQIGNRDYVEITRFDYGDYVETALNNKFSLSLTGLIDSEEYKSRLLAMATVYKLLNSRSIPERGQWSVISFDVISSNNNELREAQDHTNIQLSDKIYKFKVSKHGNTIIDQIDHQKIRIQLQETVTLFLNQIKIIFKSSVNNQWRVFNIE